MMPGKDGQDSDRPFNTCSDEGREPTQRSAPRVSGAGGGQAPPHLSSTNPSTWHAQGQVGLSPF